jgi:hypothetical protein
MKELLHSISILDKTKGFIMKSSNIKDIIARAHPRVAIHIQ